MNWLDLVILVIIIITTLTGLKTGLIKSVLSLVGLVVGVVLAGRYYADVAKLLTFIPQESIARIVAFAIILVVVMIIAGVLASVMKFIASIVMLGWLNHLGGAVFGFLWGFVLSAALLATWAKFFGVAGPLAASKLAPVLLRYFPLVLSLLPQEFDSIRNFFK